MRALFTLTLFIFTTSFSVTACDKCNIDKVKAVNDHLNSLTFQIVSDFLCTFDSTCINNVEYSEWSNETLFKVLEKSPTIFFKVLARGQVDNKLLLWEIANPIHEFDLQKIYNKVESASAPTDIKSKYLKALLLLADKNRETIIK
jgi:hypothetical protein